MPSAGPYYVSSIEGDRVVLLRNPNYGGSRPRRPARIVYFDDIETQKAAALADGGAIEYVPQGDAPLDPGGARDRAYGPGSPAARAGRRRYFREPMPWVDGLVLNAARPLFADVRLRRAVNTPSTAGPSRAAFADDPTDELVPRAVSASGPGGCTRSCRTSGARVRSRGGGAAARSSGTAPTASSARRSRARSRR